MDFHLCATNRVARTNCGTSAAGLPKFIRVFGQFHSSRNGLTELCATHKSAGVPVTKQLCKALPKNGEGRLRMKPVVYACLLIGPFVALSGSAAKAIDLAELAPCKPAAARMCDRTGGMTWTNLLRCGATLAAHSWRIGDGCRAVLRKYGQL